ncbi:MAG: RsmB/NOP family class I SAM-dependent RNA methyltransferase [Erysipelotrichaceae bacterium]|nr:RsmB/NOP family class I SAM-dependent RNA methyltransferase [Erysipelotrichaceae bacterium]
MNQLPSSFLENMKSLLESDYDNYIDTFSSPRTYGLRVNTHKISVQDFLAISPFTLTPVPWTDNGFYYDGAVNPAKHPYYYAGLYYLQEPSAMFPAATLPVRPGDRVLDLCAAPGGKSTELAARLQGKGLLVSNDISASRCKPLLRNLERFGFVNTFVCSESPQKLAERFPAYFDKILIDAPCSGEGMFRKDPTLIKNWTTDSNDTYRSLQKEIVRSALQMLKPGGDLLYSTCTFSPKENEEVIAYMLEQDPTLSLTTLEQPGFENGIGLRECVRIYPHKVKGEGHFIALIHKEGTLSGSGSEQRVSMPAVLKESLPDMHMPLVNGRFETIKDKLYYMPDMEVSRKGLRFLRTGLYLGDCKKNRFDPSQALAMALSPDTFKTSVSFSSNDERVKKYLKGETISIDDKKIKGWTLICVDGYPLGFGKASKGMIKNKLDAGWRIL